MCAYKYVSIVGMGKLDMCVFAWVESVVSSFVDALCDKDVEGYVVAVFVPTY